MKLPLQNPKYLIVIGLVIFLCITGVTFFTGKVLEKRMHNIADFAGVNLYRQKVLLYQYEFNNIMKGTQMVSNVFPDLGPQLDSHTIMQTLGTVLMADDKVKNAWYAIVNGKDTSYVYLVKEVNTFKQKVMPAYIKNWVRKQFTASSINNTRGQQDLITDSLHWLTSNNTVVGKRGKLLSGLDIDLLELQRAFVNIDSKGMSYAYMMDENGVCIISPNERQIGKKLYLPKLTPITGKNENFIRFNSEVVESEYLGLPVTRYYIPTEINGLKWTIVVNIPLFILEEDVVAIRKYSVYLGLISVSIILGLIWLYQRKWQREFLLRREVEINRQEVSMEKQGLKLIASQQEKENAMIQLSKLKEKVNPHFLFNSLSSLNALIDQDSTLAKSFVVKLSRVYRYVLESNPSGLSTVEEELYFMKEYFFLLKIRFGDALQPLDINIDAAELTGKIPFISLQTLIENAVKHNILSKEKPLKITIESKKGVIVVSNNLQLRPDVKNSVKQGLNYLKSTYSYFENQEFTSGIEAGFFKCYLPVLHLTEY
ncbi:histidine kinase [Pedobacter nototheniae]|uniref:histidine kinase n=1 Tax=Pedobacter nototheniae TaxID=2488994 RepID=UPI00103EDE73|nr:histidine kinase [Pedobacter nototheniae]